MGKRFYLQSTTTPSIKFQILDRNKQTGLMKLKGAYCEFEEIMTKEKMQQYKYTITVEEFNDAN